MDPSVCLYLSPTDIYYSQDTISASFHDGRMIGRTLDALVNMEIFVTDLPPITVVLHDDRYFTRNNRRLWVFKQLKKLGRCEYIPTILASELPFEQFTTEIGGHEIVVRGNHGSAELRGFHAADRQNTFEDLQTMHKCPVKKKFALKFSPRFKFPKSDKEKAKQRRILRAKRKKIRLVLPSTGAEATGFDFDEYAKLAGPKVAFSSEKEMVFEGKEPNPSQSNATASKTCSAGTNKIPAAVSKCGANGSREVGGQDQEKSRKRKWHMTFTGEETSRVQ